MNELKEFHGSYSSHLESRLVLYTVCDAEIQLRRGAVRIRSCKRALNCSVEGRVNITGTRILHTSLYMDEV